MTQHNMQGRVTKVEWLTWPVALKEKLPVTVGDVVYITLEHTHSSDPQTSTLVESFEYTVQIANHLWKSDGFHRTQGRASGMDRWMEGDFPNIKLTQMDFLNPWQPAAGSYSQNDQSLISLDLKEAGEMSQGRIESQGDFMVGMDSTLSVFVIEYRFDSNIIK